MQYHIFKQKRDKEIFLAEKKAKKIADIAYNEGLYNSLSFFKLWLYPILKRNVDD